ncbi:5-oxoprolinase subunit PxpB [Ferrimonas gelatinilytica]|uniref:5-oxoprolinase subunit PxpB n=1 Tax=Ferrimonas gelatinilytica TaxID=1255257 RepID=A0ABP9RYW2_9GAMM
MTLPFQIETLSENALMLRWPPRQDPDTQRQIHAIIGVLDALPGLRDAVPTYHCLGLWFDPNGPQPEIENLKQFLHQHRKKWRSAPPVTGRHRTLPVCYELGEDLDTVAQLSQLSVEAVIARHCAPTYSVCFLGFTPGFAYLSGLPEALQLPRRASPRATIPAGSVAIGGSQTGIYPSPSPGGWHLIGRTPQPLLDLNQESVTWLLPGDTLTFEPISTEQYQQLCQQNEAHPCWK